MDDVEQLPDHTHLVLGPGSKILGDDGVVTVEWPIGDARPTLTLDGVNLSGGVEALLGHTSFDDDAGFEPPAPGTLVKNQHRQVLEFSVARLLWLFERSGGMRTDPHVPHELAAELNHEMARMEIRRAVTPCHYEGDPEAPVRVLVTGFAPFPARASHDNVSSVGVLAIRPEVLVGAQLMRAVLPVEYDHAAALVTEMLERCRPDVVINFGQGSGPLALEQIAYNLKHTRSHTADNRGVAASGQPIDPEGPATRATTLPLAAIAEALEGIDEPCLYSTDPGRYICNNVFYVVTGLVADTHIKAGFVHLPHVTRFDDEVAAHWGKVMETIVQAVVDHDGAKDDIDDE
ncbi:MAG: hypothetical protein ACE366_03400 [Bradymonadia bacterium]